MNIEMVVQTLQASVAPALLISGFGFLLLSMTNRLGRASDRIRSLNASVQMADKKDVPKMCKQIGVLFKRCKFLQTSIALIVFSIFFVGINILLMFVAIVYNADLQYMILLFFASSVGCLIVSLVFFLLDIRITLKSLRIEVGPHLDHNK